MASANSQNPNGADPLGVGAPPGATPTKPTDIAGGFDPTTYHPPLGANPPYEGLHPGPSTTTVFGTPLHEGMYTSDQAWSLPLADPESIPDIQRALIAAGLLNPKDVRLGLWDGVSASAYRQVLGFANAYGLRAHDALSVMLNNPQAAQNQGPARVAPTFTNPIDVQSNFQNVSQALTGTEMSADQGFAQAFHQQEAATGHLSGESYTQAPNVQNAAQQYLIKNNPDDVRAFGVASRMNEFFNMLNTPAK